MTHPTDVDILIVGAGPTGLTLACLMARYGVKFRIIDKNKTITDRSKALGIQARTLELFEQLGIAERALELGHPAVGLDLVVHGKIRASISLQEYGKGLTKYPYLFILEQSKTEQLLLNKLRFLTQEVQWQRELIELETHPNFVRASIAHFEAIENITAKYVVGADGAHSSVRQLLQIPFSGGTYENRFMLADIALKWGFSSDHITVCLSKNGFAGFFPMYGMNRYRAIGISSEDTPSNADQYFASIAEDIKTQAGVPMTISDPRWIATYKLHHRVVDKFQMKRCFLAGDAAHIHSPAGAQGMNTGIQDAFNLAWKLNMVLKGQASESLLKTYHEERYPFAKKLTRTTDQAFFFVTTQRPLFKWLRFHILPHALNFLTRFESFRNFVFKTISQIKINYRKSTLSEQNFIPGRPPQAGDRFEFQEQNADGFFHAFMIGSQKIQEEAGKTLRMYLGWQVKIHTLASRSDIHAVFQAYSIHKDGLILVRPDEYVCYVSEGIDIEELNQYLRKYYKQFITDAGKEWEPLLDKDLTSER